MPEELLPWVLLFTAILFEVAGITSMKLSRGFSEPLPSLAVPVFYIFSALAVILALKRLVHGLCHLVWRRHGASCHDRHHLFPGAAHPVQDHLARVGDFGRARTVARRAPDQLTESPSFATIGSWTVSSARATVRSGLPCSSACFCLWR